MEFRLSYTIQDFPLADIPRKIKLSKSGILIEFKAPPADYKGKDGTMFCDAYISKKPNESNLEILNRIENRIDLEIEHDATGYSEIELDDGSKYVIPDLSFFPKGFISFHRSVNDELTSAIRETVKSIMWHSGWIGRHNPFSSRSLGFSPDGDRWYRMPSGMGISFEILQTHFSISDKLLEQISQQESEEPLHHSLYREAWHLKSENRRSALILGLAALESATKHTIVSLVPNSNLFVENAVAPPITKLLSIVIPSLPIRYSLSGYNVEPGKEVLDNLKKWTHQRNILIHRGGELAWKINVKSVLETVRDLIYLLDYYCGHEWAINHVSEEFLEQMKK